MTLWPFLRAFFSAFELVLHVSLHRRPKSCWAQRSDAGPMLKIVEQLCFWQRVATSTFSSTGFSRLSRLQLYLHVDYKWWTLQYKCTHLCIACSHIFSLPVFLLSFMMPSVGSNAWGTSSAYCCPMDSSVCGCSLVLFVFELQPLRSPRLIVFLQKRTERGGRAKQALWDDIGSFFWWAAAVSSTVITCMIVTQFRTVCCFVC